MERKKRIAIISKKLYNMNIGAKHLSLMLNHPSVLKQIKKPDPLSVDSKFIIKIPETRHERRKRLRDRKNL